MRGMIGFFGTIAAIYAVVVFLAWMFQDRMIYFPESNIYQTPADQGMDYEEVWLETEDGEDIHGWFVKAEEPRGTLLFFHGNAGNIADRVPSIEQFHSLGLNVMIIDYRGYGRSTGMPSEEGLYKDARAAWQYLTTDREIPFFDIVLFGRSLGGAVATQLASEQRAAGLILESTFTSLADMGTSAYPWLPVRWLLKENYDTLGHMDQIEIPVMIAHSPNDEIVPYRQGERLYNAANQPKEWLEMLGGHGGGWLATGQHYLNRMDEFFSMAL